MGSTLVGKIKSEHFTGKSFDQQTMINAACGRVSNTANQGYYPLSWQVIAQMTLNGEVAKAGALFQGPPQVNPTESPTLFPVQPVTPGPSKAPTIPEGCYSINYKDCLPDVASGDEFCNKIWLPTGAKNNCASLGSVCGSNQASCCEPAHVLPKVASQFASHHLIPRLLLLRPQYHSLQVYLLVLFAMMNQPAV